MAILDSQEKEQEIEFGSTPSNWSSTHVSKNRDSFGEKYVECVLEALIKTRKGRNITQDELACRLNVDQSIVCRTEKGLRELKLQMFYDWCVALDTTPEDVARGARAIAMYRHQDETVFVELLKNWVKSPTDGDPAAVEMLGESLSK